MKNVLAKMKIGKHTKKHSPWLADRQTVS